jgi:mRNA interferase RelE/StbE
MILIGIKIYKITYNKKVIKFIKKRVFKDKDRILKRFYELKKNPYPTNKNLDIKKLQNRDGFRLRISDFRFLYDIQDNELIIYMEDANNRGDIYK